MNRTALALVASIAFAAGTAVASAGTTASSNATEVRETKALNLLEANGYTDFSNFHPDGRAFEADVSVNGQQKTVRVDPDTGQIQTIL